MNALEISMNERKYNIAEILDLANKNPLIDFNIAKTFFLKFSQEIDIYKYTGDNHFLKIVMDNEILNNTYGFKDFLLTHTYANKEVTVYDAIFSLLI